MSTTQIAGSPGVSHKIAGFCRRHHIRKLALFGSVLREDFSDESDVDALVEFEGGHTPDFLYCTTLSRNFRPCLAAARLIWLHTGRSIAICVNRF